MILLITLIIMCCCIPCFILIPGVNSAYCCCLCFVLILNLIYGFKNNTEFTCANPPENFTNSPHRCTVGKLKNNYEEIGCPDEGCNDEICCDGCDTEEITNTWSRLYKDGLDKDGNAFNFSTRMTETTYSQRKESVLCRPA